MKIIKVLAILFIITPMFVFSQTVRQPKLDSLYNLYMGLRTGSRFQQGQVASSADIKRGGYIKCGFGLSNQLRLNFNSFSPGQQEELKKILARPILDTSIVSPSGKFRIHYDTTGTDKPGYSINDLAIAMDSSYNYEVTFLGYPAPPTDNNEGGDNLYDIYVLNLGILYGETDFSVEITPGSSKYTTYILMDNDFSGYFTEGIDAARVTAAHEFHHAIQVGDYIFRSDDLYFYELTSTAFEEFVYPSINDYFQYLSSYFNNTQVSFASTQGYDFSIWDLYLHAKFGPGIIKRQWELMPTNRSIIAINKSLVENKSTFSNSLKEFGLWTFYTNYRSVSGKYFKDGLNYPIARPVSTMFFNSTVDTVNLTAKALSNNFLKFTNVSDTVDVIVSNTDVQSGVDSLRKNFSAQYILFSTPVTGAVRLNDKYYSKLNVKNPGIWQISEFVNGKLVVPTMPPLPTSEIFAYPNPYNYRDGSAIYLPVSIGKPTTATLNIYSASLNLMYSNSINVININGKNFVLWNGRQTNNNKLPSGVYVYITKVGDNILKGKLVIFNE